MHDIGIQNTNCKLGIRDTRRIYEGSPPVLYMISHRKNGQHELKGPTDFICQQTKSQNRLKMTRRHGNSRCHESRYRWGNRR